MHSSQQVCPSNMMDPNRSLVSYQTNTSSLLYPPPPVHWQIQNTNARQQSNSHNSRNTATLFEKVETPTFAGLCRDLLMSLKFALFLAVILGLVMLALTVDVNNKNDPLLGRVLSPIVVSIIDSVKNLLFHPAFYGSFLAVLVLYVLYKIVMLHLDYQKRKRAAKPIIEYPEDDRSVNERVMVNPMNQQFAIQQPCLQLYQNQQHPLNPQQILNNMPHREVPPYVMPQPQSNSHAMPYYSNSFSSIPTSSWATTYNSNNLNPRNIVLDRNTDCTLQNQTNCSNLANTTNDSGMFTSTTRQVRYHPGPSAASNCRQFASFHQDPVIEEIESINGVDTWC